MRKGWLSALVVAGLAVSCGKAPAPPCRPMADADQRLVVYHGINVCNYSKTAPDFLPWHTREDFARLRDWGFNLVRFLVFWEAIEPERDQFNEAYLAAVRERLGWLRDLGIDVLLDIHQDLYCRKFTGNGFPAWTVNDDAIPFTQRQPWNLNYLEPAVIRSYDRFWSSPDLKLEYIEMVDHLLDRVEDLPNVIGVDLINEPFPGSNPDFEPVVLSDFYRSAEAMMRAKHPSFWLFFEAMMFTSAGLPTMLTFQPGDRSVFAPHYYDPFCHEGAPYTPRARQWMRRTVGHFADDARRFGTPVVFTEFGVSPAVEGYTQLLNDLLDTLDARGMGWCYYSYDKSGHEAFGIVDNAGTEKELLRHIVRAYPQRVAGTNLVFSVAGNALDVAYDAVNTASPTILFIPPGYRDVAVEVNGQPTELRPENGYLTVPDTARAGKRQRIRVTWR